MNLEPMDGIATTMSGGALTIRIDRPERRNALTPDHMNHIGQLCAAAEHDDEVRGVVLTGTGDAFCAGADLAQADLSAGGGQLPPFTADKNLFVPLLELSKPLIGVINGVAAGGGLGLALCCDLRIASERARFATSFTRIGLTANDAVGYLLPRIVGVAKALELIYLATPIDAAEALDLGLVSYVEPHDNLATFAADLVTRILQGPPSGLRFSKRLVIDGMDRTYREHVLAQEYASLANRTLANHDILEGVAAFKEKRRPSFRGVLAKPRWQNY
ncbi:enoyl-CoA hydratase/isomerase family protein [Mycobacterium sp. 94-17]|uniref:enoyl-CoA hydratase/isomerase family protein n=1 Tax=Mycobacterium sp. 94-17 TaxID=2986147 RepID=UPI002D1E5603|nr:enoyl-CoA hydratase-related protein [Mycobacterium sp. 94-17]MEB4209790.1 enoyl-CoA hydratase-related protein [Mycobacterium sp. 94-17]